jgi:glycosidase
MPESLYSAEFLAVYNSGSPGFPSPADWRDQPIYFLLVDRFNNPHRRPAHSPFDDPQFDGYQGGSFEGVRSALGYIKRLGAGAIWLSPVLKNYPFSASYHGYGIHDFLQAEPRFATDPAKADDELRALVDAAHAEGLFVIFDIVLNHIGDGFAYASGAQAPFSPTTLPVQWRDATGAARQDWPSLDAIPVPPRDALVWPRELQRDAFFRRQGAMPAPDDDTVGDFASLKQMLTEKIDLQNQLIRAYQYVIARFDVDGLRIDTLRYLKGGLALTFGNAIREYALSIGKKNFFTFGEVWTGDSEAAIARFIGRNTNDGGDLVGVDAALDYPLFNVMKPTVKGLSAPRDVMAMYQRRKDVERDILSSHGDSTRYFVTFLDNHDVKERLRHFDPSAQASLDAEVTLGVACLACLPGIPCIYYGTEQGLHGAGPDDAAVREALWGGPGLDEGSTFYRSLSAIAAVRAEQPALRYGRFYFRQLSGDGKTFGFSGFRPGVLAFSRILNDREILVVANFNKTTGVQLDVVIDATLNPAGSVLKVLFSSLGSGAPGLVAELAATTVEQVDGSTSQGTVHAVRVALRAGEVQILA